MRRFLIQCADITAEIHCKYAFTQNRCSKYTVIGKQPDVVIEPKISDIEMYAAQLVGQAKEYIEFMTICYMLHDEILKLDAALLHASSLAVDGMGYAFAAPSGTGKTTHTMQWKKLFGSRCIIVNGDKPIVTFRDGGVFVCGTPWCGKEVISENITVPLRAICFLERGEENEIKRITGKEITDRLFYQLLMPGADSPQMAQYLKLADRLIKTVPFYLLRCNISTEAARVAYNVMSSNL